MYVRWTVVFAVLTGILVVMYAAVLQSGVFLTLSAVTAFFMLAFLILGQISARATERRMLDIAFVRLSGPIEIQSYQVKTAGNNITRYRLLMGEHQIHLDPAIAVSLDGVTHGAVVFVPFTYGRNILLEVLDGQGQSLYRRPGYQP